MEQEFYDKYGNKIMDGDNLIIVLFSGFSIVALVENYNNELRCVANMFDVSLATICIESRNLEVILNE